LLRQLHKLFIDSSLLYNVQANKASVFCESGVNIKSRYLQEGVNMVQSIQQEGCAEMKQNKNMDMQSRIGELERLLRDFKEKFEAGTSDAENFITMHEIEQMWSELRGNTDYIYSDMLGELMSGVDESELIRKKKENTKKKESS
jgi:hypothetical protein